jgi:hypothetical protein
MEVGAYEFLTFGLAELVVKVQALAVLSLKKPPLVLCALQVVVTAYPGQPLRITSISTKNRRVKCENVRNQSKSNCYLKPRRIQQ